MTATLKENQRLVCVGQTALRAPDGTFLPAVPLYKIVCVDYADERGSTPCTEELTKGESGLYDDIAAVFGEKFKQYVDGVEGAGV